MSKNIFRYLTLNKYSESVLKKSEFYCTLPNEINDPFDSKGIFDYYGTEADYVKHFEICLRKHRLDLTESDIRHSIETYINSKLWQSPEFLAKLFQEFRASSEASFSNLGMVCFSKKKNNILMWSHYAGGHRGFCLEFDRTLLERECHAPLEDIKYKLPTFSDLMAVTDNEGNEIAKRLSLSKARDWKYESEIRMIVPLNSGKNVEGLRDNRYKQFPKEALTGVIFGCLMSGEDKDTIKSILSSEPRKMPKFYQAIKSNNAYTVTISRIY